MCSLWWPSISDWSHRHPASHRTDATPCGRPHHGHVHRRGGLRWASLWRKHYTRLTREHYWTLREWEVNELTRCARPTSGHITVPELGSLELGTNMYTYAYARPPVCVCLVDPSPCVPLTMWAMPARPSPCLRTTSGARAARARRAPRCPRPRAQAWRPPLSATTGPWCPAAA